MGNWEEFSDLNIQRFADQYFMDTFPGLKGCLFILGITIYQGNNPCSSSVCGFLALLSKHLQKDHRRVHETVSEGFVRAQKEAVNVLPPTEAGVPNKLSEWQTVDQEFSTLMNYLKWYVINNSSQMAWSWHSSRKQKME